MGRSKKGPRRLPPVVGLPEVVLPHGTVEDWRADTVTVRLTARILERARTSGRAASEAVVAIGRHMLAIRQRLSHGQWVAWASEAVPWARSTVHNYVGLALFADDQPEDFERFAALGPTKLQRLAVLRPSVRRRFRRTTALPIPGGTPKTVDRMNVAELDAVIRAAIGTDDTLAVPPPPPIATVLAGARKRVSDLEAFVEQLQARRAEVDLGDVVALHAEVVSLEAALRDGFGLPVS